MYIIKYIYYILKIVGWPWLVLDNFEISFLDIEKYYLQLKYINNFFSVLNDIGRSNWLFIEYPVSLKIIYSVKQ